MGLMTRASRILLLPFAVALGFAPQAFAQAPAKKFITPNGQRPNGLFAPGVMVGKTLYVAGKGDYRPNAPFPEKVENCLNEIRKTLTMAGLDMRHVVKSFVYLEDPDQFPEFNKQYAKFFPNDPPARTTLGVPQVPGDSRVEITCIAYSDLSERKRIGETRAGFPYSPGILAGTTLYVSGKGDQKPDGSHPETFEEQVRQCLRNVQTTLKEAGLDAKNVVMSHVFLDKYENLEVTKKVYQEFFEAGNEPACATVFVDWIPGGSHVEVTCIATTDLTSRKVVRPSGMSAGTLEASVAASPAVWAGDTLYMSGLSGFKSPADPVTAGLDEQVHQMGKNHTAVLEAAGLKLDDIVAGWVYLRDMKDYAGMNAIYREYYSKGPGVRTCLMPNSTYEKNGILTRGSFIASRTK
jgi:2-iminobutanoate/2-iminopropanoate deaminase